jgi:hypothetical protein
MSNSDVGTVIVRNSRKGCVMIPELGMLRPGVNVCDARLVKAAEEKTKGNAKKGSKSSWPDCVIVDKGAPVGTEGRSDLDAVNLVKDTFDIEMLKDWRAGETRKPVLKAIDEQIELMMKEPDEDGDDE